VLPERLDASYIGEDGQKHRPVMLHRAILGSLERFLGVLIEHHAGAFPLWLAPVQVVVATITSDADDYAVKAAAALRKAGLRVETDLRNEKVGYKVREHSLAKVPVIAVVGRREAEEGKVVLRRRGGSAESPARSRRRRAFQGSDAARPAMTFQSTIFPVSPLKVKVFLGKGRGREAVRFHDKVRAHRGPGRRKPPSHSA
jgi:threonyl-tRNA synthetase